MNVLDLFSGIGGFSLGLERAGMRTVAFCEIDDYCSKVLRKHWPHVPIHDDIRTLNADQLPTDIDVICGGFPCQDISLAGVGAGIAGERSGLWSEYARIIDEVGPRYVIVENVAALLGRGLDRVLGDLAALGFDAEWHCIPASAVGAPHRRDRIWIIATDARGQQHEGGSPSIGREIATQLSRSVADAPAVFGPEIIGDESHGDFARSQTVANSTCEYVNGSGQTGAPGWREPSNGSWWGAEPNVDRVAHGVPSRVDRLRGLGNAVVPQIPEIIGRAIMEHRNG